ncbi:MAG: tetratricopeptide repeat protein [Myxococcota bacterium]
MGLALADDALAAGETDAARSHLETANSHLALAYSGWVEGRLLRQEGAYDEAAARLEAAIEADAGGSAALLERARALNRAGDPLGALKSYEAFRAAGGRSPRGLVEEAQIRLDRRDDTGALANLEALSAFEPDHPSAYVLKAEVLYRQGREEEALAEVKTALKLSPKLSSGRLPEGVKRLHPGVLTGLGSLTLISDRTKGLALLRGAVEDDDAPPEAHFMLGKALVGRKRTRKEGRKALARYLALAPQGPHAKEAAKLSRRRR